MGYRVIVCLLAIAGGATAQPQRQDQTPLRLDPNGNSKHPAKSLEARITPMQEGIEDYFGIAASLESQA